MEDSFKEQNLPLVTIGIITYNSAKTVIETLESAKAHKRLKNKCGNFTNEERIRTQKIIKDVESKLFKMICRATTGLTKILLIVRFVYKLEIS